MCLLLFYSPVPYVYRSPPPRALSPETLWRRSGSPQRSPLPRPPYARELSPVSYRAAEQRDRLYTSGRISYSPRHKSQVCGPLNYSAILD
jgi:hypothetical protein